MWFIIGIVIAAGMLKKTSIAPSHATLLLPQYHLGLAAGKPDFVACEQQSRRPACASAQSGQHLCY